jgi:hypothetical protein
MSSSSIRSNRRGAILPLTVIVLAVMAVAVAITYARLSSERVISGDRKAQAGAFVVAQSGLNRYLAVLGTSKPAASATVNYVDLPGGTAQVDVRMLRESTTTMLPAVYVITSRGRYTAARSYNSRTPSAERTVATYAIWTPTPFDLNGAYTSLAGIQQNGAGSGGLSGIDHCTAANGGGFPSIPGVALPTGAGPNGTAYGGSVAPIDGNPEDVPVPIGTPGPGGTAKDAVDIDWAGIVAGTTMPPDYTAWPASFTTPKDWPIVKINGDFSIPSSGKGILIVTGNLTWLGTPLRTWEGLILVGGTVISNGQANLYGAMITALNVKLGMTVLDYNIGNGTKLFQYDSCALRRALGKIGSLERVRNGWTDTWPSY